ARGPRGGRHSQALSGSRGAGRRLAPPAQRRDPGPGRRERRRQEHADQDPHRRLPAGRRQRHDRRGARSFWVRARRVEGGDQRRPPGAQPDPAVHRGREHPARADTDPASTVRRLRSHLPIRATLDEDGGTRHAGDQVGLRPQRGPDAAGRGRQGPLPARGEPVLEVRDLATEAGARGITFSLHRGEILGLYGLVGAGRTELAKAIIGELKVTGGDVLVRGRSARIRDLRDALARHRIGYVSENRKEEGLILLHSVLTNMSITIWRRLRLFGQWIRRSSETTAV